MTPAITGAACLLLSGLAGIMLLRRRLAVVTIAGHSMLPAFLDGDRVLVRRAGLDDLRVGQVIVFERPGNDGSWTTAPPGWPAVGGREWLIKRVAAIPGDVRPDALLPPATAGAETTVPAGKIVVLGDNQTRSYDSRQLGYVPDERLVCIVVRPLPHKKQCSPSMAGSMADSG
jgi:signal peptidase I